MGKTNKMNLVKFEDFLAQTKGKTKTIFYKLDQAVQKEPPYQIGEQMVQPPPTFRAAIVLTATDEANEKGEKNYWVHLWMSAQAKIDSKDAQEKWDKDMAGYLSQLKKDIQTFAPGLGIVEGTVEVI